MSYAAMAGVAQRNGTPDRQTLCRITDSLRAKATRALPEPERRSIASAQSFRCSGRFTRCRITVAASYMSVRARPSPHREMCPLRSVSPDALIGFWGDGGTSQDQSRDESAKESFASASGVVHELEEAEIQRQLLLRDAPVWPQPGA